MKIYLDNCCFNRPFDDQNQIRIRLESEAKLYIQEKIRDGELKLSWSYIMDIEAVVVLFRLKNLLSYESVNIPTRFSCIASFFTERKRFPYRDRTHLA